MNPDYLHMSHKYLTQIKSRQRGSGMIALSHGICSAGGSQRMYPNDWGTREAGRKLMTHFTIFILNDLSRYIWVLTEVVNG